MMSISDFVMRSQQAAQFFEKLTSTPEGVAKLEAANSHKELLDMAKQMGIDLDRVALANGLKAYVDHKMIDAGLPSWVVSKINTPVHD